MVKLILLTLLISFNSYASYKVAIVNEYGQSMSKTGFETEADAQVYKDRVKHKWGREDGWYRKPCVDVSETREVVDSFDTYTEYHCPKNYSAVTSPIEGWQAKIDKEAADKIKIEELKVKDKSMKLDELIELLKLKGII